MDRDTVVLFEIFQSQTFVARDVGWREVGLLQDLGSGRSEVGSSASD